MPTHYHPTIDVVVVVAFDVVALSQVVVVVVVVWFRPHLDRKILARARSDGGQ